MSTNIIKPDEFRRVQWKNGRGITKELAVHFVKGESRYLWRISVASVDTDGPFSDFSGYERSLIMLEGKGIRLKHSGRKESILKDTSAVADFSGDGLTYAELIEGPIKDFNVMCLRGKCNAVTSVQKAGSRADLSCADVSIYSPYRTSVFSVCGKEYSLPEDHLFRISTEIKTVLSVKRGEVIVVRINYL